jgi:hypothetical protein
LTDAGGWFDGEIRETWTAFTSERYLTPGAVGVETRERRDQLLADAEVILGGWPFPLDLRARAPNLKWFHQRPAGASNLRAGDLWGDPAFDVRIVRLGQIWQELVAVMVKSPAPDRPADGRERFRAGRGQEASKRTTSQFGVGYDIAGLR